MQLANGWARSQAVTSPSLRYGLAVGARKMIDHEYDHAVESIQSNIYVTPNWIRLLTETDTKILNALG